MAVKWLDDPEDHDYDAAADYLTIYAGDLYASYAEDECDVTITVTDSSGAFATKKVSLYFSPVNDPPTIVLNSADPQMTAANTPTGAISFTVTDIDDPPCSLMLGSFTSDDLLLPTRTFSPVGSCTAVGDSATRTITITPGMDRTGSGMVT